MKIYLTIRANGSDNWVFFNPLKESVMNSNWLSYKKLLDFQQLNLLEYYSKTLKRFLERMVKYEN